jgi:hypothetical protein
MVLSTPSHTHKENSMVMRSGNDTRGRRILPGDHLHLLYQVGKDVELAAWATASMTTRATDLWEEQEDVLATAYGAGTFEPGQYRVVTYANYSGAEIGRLDRPLPLPSGWVAMTKHGSTGLPARGFAVNVLKWYPGTTVELLAEHITTFAQHYGGEISTAELEVRTGYALPEGSPRPTGHGVIIIDDNR